MTDRERDRERDEPLEGRLKKAWSEAVPPPVPEGWLDGVMSEVRAHKTPESTFAVVHRIIFRGAVAAVVMALASIGFCLVLGATPGVDLAQVIAMNPTSLLELILVY